MRCILFIIVALPGVNTVKAWEFLEFGEMHPVHYWSPPGVNAATPLEFLGFCEMHPVSD